MSAFARLVFAPPCTGKSHYVRTRADAVLYRVRDGDALIASARIWPRLRRWWEVLPPEEIHLLKRQITTYLTETSQAEGSIVLINGKLLLPEAVDVPTAIASVVPPGEVLEAHRLIRVEEQGLNGSHPADPEAIHNMLTLARDQAAELHLPTFPSIDQAVHAMLTRRVPPKWGRPVETRRWP